ncbi:MAG TPA: 3-phosphoshikimate 1-carboxyvinyltransferase [Steroidobacteraceae bacterium]|nr:3-phosphoshikimate 1-carboxyvinyltransferase [Steroidobacteraceae bacterium]
MGMSYRVAPADRVAGSITVPGDKSISHRALMLGSLAEGRTQVTGFLDGDDCLSTLRAIAQLGVRVERPAAGEVVVEGVGLHGLRAPQATLDMGNAGTAMRLFMGLLCAQPFDSELVGDETLMRRPMERAAKPLRTMGARIETQDGKPPVRIRGGATLHGVRYEMPVASAQVKSAVLLAGLYADGATTVIEPAVTRDHTERMLQGFGVDVKARDGVVTIAAPASLKAARIRVPGDISSAAFFLVAACLGAREPFTLRDVGVNPTRTGILEMLALMGADIRLINHRTWGREPVADIEVRPSQLEGARIPERLVPLAIDEFPAFFVAAACAEGETLVTGAEELRVKESDRIAAMARGFEVLGIEHEVLPDGMRIRGGRPIGGGVVDSRGDHRIAMSFAVASLRASAPIEILDVENVATSFPGFDVLANSVGLDVVPGSV